jgi:hypothetical protein
MNEIVGFHQIDDECGGSGNELREPETSERKYIDSVMTADVVISCPVNGSSTAAIASCARSRRST